VVEEPSLIEYPCPFPIKVVGRMQKDFAQTVFEIVKRHDPGFDAATMEMRPSRGGKYLSVTVTVQATSREQLDSLYRELCDHPMVTMVL